MLVANLARRLSMSICVISTQLSLRFRCNDIAACCRRVYQRVQSLVTKFGPRTIKAVVAATEISSSNTVVVGLPAAMGVTVGARTIEMFEDPTPVKKKPARKQKATKKEVRQKSLIGVRFYDRTEYYPERDKSLTSRGGRLSEIRREKNTFHNSQSSSPSALLRVNKQHDNASHH